MRPLNLTKQTEGARIFATTSYQGYDVEIVTGWLFQRDAWQALATVARHGHAKKMLSSEFFETCDTAMRKMADEVQQALDADKV